MILSNCRLIPELCEGFQEETADIRIEGDSIAEILPAGGRYAGEEVIDCAARTVMPGLHDLHVHLMMHGFNWVPEGPYMESPQEALMHSVRYMNKLLVHGYTSIRDVGCAYNTALKLRDTINSGRMVGPNIKASGYILTPDTETRFPFYSSSFGEGVNSPHEIRAAVRRLIVEGADFIKIMACGLFRPQPIFYPDEMEELQRSVQNEGTYFAAHTVSEEANTSAIEYEAYTIEHGMMWSQANMDHLIAKGYRSNLVPTVHILAYSGSYRPEIGEALVKGLRMPYDDGKVLIGWGTDIPEFMFTETPECEFVARERALGYSRIDLLKQATINSAKINGTEELRGSIKVGKRADLIVIDGDPLKDLHVFHNPPDYVLKDGVVVASHGMVKAF